MKTFSKNMRNVVISEDLMNKITALCDVIIAENNDAPLTSVAMSIRKEIDKGLEYGVATSIF